MTSLCSASWASSAALTTLSASATGTLDSDLRARWGEPGADVSRRWCRTSTSSASQYGLRQDVS